MRKMLFRGKRIDNGEWVFGSYVFEPRRKGAFGQTVSELDSERHYISSKRNYEFWEVIPETVGQYTGLTDKNGKKIFEGDIVKEWSAWWRTPNKIECNTFEVVCKHLGTLLLIRKNRWGEESTTLNRNSTVEVIGTIYDNPELLEVER